MASNSGTKFKPELAASVLVEAAYTSDEKAAQKYGVSVQSVYNWRKRLEEDDEFRSIFSIKRERFEAEWATELPNAIRACIDFIKRAALEASHTKPDVIYSVAGALKIVSDIQMSKDIIDARLIDFNRQTRETDQAMAYDSRSASEPERISAGQHRAVVEDIAR